MELKKIRLPFKINEPVLALGAHTKNTLCFALGQTAYLSTAHPDLSNPKDLSGFEKSAEYFLKKKPKIIACDLHPEYQSTKFAHTLSTIKYRLSAIQHHHAHIASCMAENGLKNQKIIGVAFDGTGLGTDNTLWGAEVLVCDYKSFRRSAHLKEVPLLGGEKAVSEPYRLTAAWLYQIYGENFLSFNLGLLKDLDKNKWRIIKNMYLKKFNSPMSSSAGRLFDASASLILEKPKADFEAELAIELEKLAARYNSTAEGYSFDIIKTKGGYIIDPARIFRGIIADLKAKQAKEKIAYRFHLTLAQIIQKLCLILRKETGINKIVLSGGCFQNKTLLRLSLDLLYNSKFKVLTHNILPCSDFGIALGQAVIANFGGG